MQVNSAPVSPTRCPYLHHQIALGRGISPAGDTTMKTVKAVERFDEVVTEQVLAQAPHRGKKDAVPVCTQPRCTTCRPSSQGSRVPGKRFEGWAPPQGRGSQLAVTIKPETDSHRFSSRYTWLHRRA